MKRWQLVLAALAVLILAACQPRTRPEAPPAAIADAAPAATPDEPAATPAPSPEAAAEPVAAPLDNGAEVFARLRARLASPACAEDADTLRWRQRYGGHPETFARRLEAVLPLLAHVLAEVEARDLPGEFVLIPWVESGYRPEARGVGGPAGLWQMVTATGRANGLRIERGYDGRFSPLDSTAAALRHLQAMQQRFGTWQAAVMAYNAGEYRLHQALRRAGNAEVAPAQRRPAGLARHTYEYVGKLQALACLLAEPEAHGIALPLVARFQPLQATTPTPGAIAGAAMPATDLREHIVRAGDTLSALARRYRVSVKQLLQWNGLQLRSVLRLGQRLRVAAP